MSFHAGPSKLKASHRWLLWLAVGLWIVAIAVYVAIYALLEHAPGATVGRAAYISLGAFCTFGIPAFCATVVAIVARRRRRR